VGQEWSQFTQLFGDTFGRTEPRELCELYLQGLLSHTERKNVEAMALQLDGPKSVRNLQRFVSNYQWDESWLRQRHWELCAESLSDEQGVWSIDASEFAKKGEASVGVAPQYCGALCQTANCQAVVITCYSGPKGLTWLGAGVFLVHCRFNVDYPDRREIGGRVPMEL